MIKKAIKKPITIEVIQWNGLNQYEIKKEFGNDVMYEIHDTAYQAGVGTPSVTMTIKTPTGIVKPEIGDYICKGYQEEIYPCKKEIFELTYNIID